VVRVLAVLHVMAMIVFLFGLSLLVPLALSFAFDDGAMLAYDEALAITLGGGALVWWLTRRHQRELTVRDGFLLVAMIWMLLPAVGTLPLYLHLPELSFTDAYFEATSGLTATGATVLSGLDKLPRSLNFWRIEMHWLGGLGIIVLAVAILPMLGVGGRQIYRAETPGPFKDSKLTPRMTETAKAFWIIYTALTAICALAYYACGMSGFDATVHAMSTLSLGGFSSHDASLGHFDSPVIEAVAILFMLVAGINFGTHFLMITRRSLRPLLHDTEAHWFVAILAASCLGVTVFLWLTGVYPEFWTALRYATFNTVSVATTLGFSSTDYGQWPIFATLWMLYLCAFVTCAGSTGGGIKLVRMQLMVKQMMRETTLLLHPRANVPLKLGGRVVPDQIVFAVLAFMSFYGASIVVLMFAMTMTGLDILTALSAVLACVNNTGPGLGQVGPAGTYAPLSDLQTWLCSIAMLLGRLELLTLFVVLSPGFWRR
jgi:trk system potassium uptake protein TrkH